jgi:hypothetical protein
VAASRLRSGNAGRRGFAPFDARRPHGGNDNGRSKRGPARTATGSDACVRSFLVRRAGIVDELSDLHEVDRGLDAVEAGHSLAHLL